MKVVDLTARTKLHLLSGYEDKMLKSRKIIDEIDALLCIVKQKINLLCERY